MNLAKYAHLAPAELAAVIRGNSAQQVIVDEHYTSQARKELLQRKEKKVLHRHPTREHKRFNQVYRNILDRCNNPKAANYKWYGAKGIYVAPEWLDYQIFFQDMWPRPGPEYSIDRIDPTGPYSKANCRWATATEQIHNRNLKGSKNV